MARIRKPECKIAHTEKSTGRYNQDELNSTIETKTSDVNINQLIFDFVNKNKLIYIFVFRLLNICWYYLHECDDKHVAQVA